MGMGKQHEVVAFCERDKYCQKILKQHWTGAPCVSDIRSMNGNEYTDIDVLTGGFPCQPFSVAGKQKGKDDNRFLWPEMLRVITEVKPRWVIGENVAGIIKMELDNVLTSLENVGYEVQAFIIPAVSVDAKHRRDRVWIVGNSISNGCSDRCEIAGREIRESEKGWLLQSSGTSTDISDSLGMRKLQSERVVENERGRIGDVCQDVPDTTGARLSDWFGKQNEPSRISEQSERPCLWPVEPGVGRVVNGLSGRVDRIKALGNAIVPQVAAEIMMAIKQTDL